jgi:hypothetical protein
MLFFLTKKSTNTANFNSSLEFLAKCINKQTSVARFKLI